MEITGSGVTLVEPNCIFADGGTFAIQDCHIHDMANILHIDNTPETSITFLVDNSYIANAGDLFWRYKAENIEVTNSTLYKMSVVARSGAMNNVKIQNCTLVDFKSTLVEDSGNLTFENNIMACFATEPKNANLAYKLSNLVSFSGNYAAASTSESLYPMIKEHGKEIDTGKFPNAWKDLTKTQVQLFDGSNQEGEFYTTITDAGDPRWRQGAQ